MARVAPLDVWEERRETGKREAETMGGKEKRRDGIRGLENGLG